MTKTDRSNRKFLRDTAVPYFPVQVTVFVCGNDKYINSDFTKVSFYLFVHLLIFFVMYSFVYLLRDVDLYFNKHNYVIMMNLKISGFLMPVQILKYAVICNIFMQARMKY